MRPGAGRSGTGVAVVSLVGILLFANAGGSPAAGAWQATPAADAGPGGCDVRPRPIEDILALSESIPGEGSVILALPAGEPADPATTAAIVSTLEAMGACLTAGDMGRFYALHSDEWLRRFAAEVEGLTTLTTSTPPLADGDRAVYLGPWHVELLGDGRVMAATLLRVGDELLPDPTRTRVLLFVRRDGRWLVDETIEQVKLAACELPVDVAAAVGPPPGAVFDAWSPSCGD